MAWIGKYLQQYRVVYKQFGWGIFLIIGPDFGGKNSFSVRIEMVSNWLIGVCLCVALLVVALVDVDVVVVTLVMSEWCSHGSSMFFTLFYYFFACLIKISPSVKEKKTVFVSVLSRK